MKNVLTFTLLALAAGSTVAGTSPPGPEAIPIGNDIAMLGASLVLAGIAARIISRRAGK